MLRLIAERGFSQKRACGLVQIDPKTVRREPEQGDAEVRARLRSLAAERRRFGCRHLGILLEREGVSMNKKRLFRLYREEGLAVRRRRGRKRATGRVPVGTEAKAVFFLDDRLLRYRVPRQRADGPGI